MNEIVMFNINVEFCEDQFGDLAVCLPDNFDYCTVVEQSAADIVADALQAVVEQPAGRVADDAVARAFLRQEVALYRQPRFHQRGRMGRLT